MANEPLEPLFVTAAELYPPPGTADAIRRRARTIRRRRRTTLSTASVVAVAGLLVQLGRVEGTSTLRPAHDPIASTVTPAPGAATATPGPKSSDPMPRTSANAGQHLRPPVRPGSGNVAPLPSTRPSGRDRATEPYGTFTVIVQDANPSAPQTSGFTCDTSAGWSAGPKGWCLKEADAENDPTVPQTYESNHWWLGVWACRPPGNGPGVLDFTVPPRLRVRTETGGSLVFDSRRRWPGQSPEYKDMYRDPDQVGDASCQFVGIGWDSRNDAGDLVPEGRYTYDFDFGDATFDSWNAAHSGPSILLTYGDPH
jgi:hypothetical protein